MLSSQTNDLLSSKDSPQVSFKKKRKEDALNLAELVYDLFKEAQAAHTNEGQNNANTHEN